MKALILATLVALTPALAQAEGFYTRDLGEGGSPEDCMARSRQALDLYAQRNSPGAHVDSGTWSVGGYAMYPGDIDVQILCPYRDSWVSITLLTAHSEGTEQERISMVDAIAAIWDQLLSGQAPGSSK